MSTEVPLHQRRLPVYVLVDCSGSMAGEPIAAMEEGLKMLLADLSCDPQALDTVWLSVITFGSTAEQLVVLTDIAQFDVPHLEVGGTTALGEAVELLLDRLEDEVRQTTPEQKGDWKPIVFIFTDGTPTDEWEEPVQRLRSQGVATVIACGAGPEAEDEFLRELGDTVVRLKDTAPGTLGAFMHWVTLSVTSASRSAGLSSDPILAPPDDEQTVTLM